MGLCGDTNPRNPNIRAAGCRNYRGQGDNEGGIASGYLGLVLSLMPDALGQRAGSLSRYIDKLRITGNLIQHGQ